MKILVNEIPKEPKKCLFARRKRYENTHTGEYEWFWSCNVNNVICDYEKGHNCNKLKVQLFQW